MAIIRASRNLGNYGTSNILYLNRKDLSARAKIVMASIVGRSDNWSVNIDYMATHWFKESRNWIYEGLMELEAFGYVKSNRTRDGQGKYGPTEYTIYELPQAELITKKSENANSPSSSSTNPEASAATKSPSPANPRPANPRPVKPALVLGGVYTSNNKQELNNQKNKQTKELSVVSFSGSKTIGDSIDESQRQQIHQVLQSLPKQPTHLDDLTQQVIFVLLYQARA